MNVFYCDNCSAKVSDIDLEDGDGTRKGEQVYCKKCKPLFEFTTTTLTNVAEVLDAVANRKADVDDGIGSRFWFCETCGKRLTNFDVASGDARDKKLRGVFCADCAVGVTTTEFTAIVPTNNKREFTQPVAREKRTSPASTHKKPSAPAPFQKKAADPAGRAVPRSFILISVGCIGFVAILTLYLRSGRSPGSGEDPVKAPEGSALAARTDNSQTPSGNVIKETSGSSQLSRTPATETTKRLNPSGETLLVDFGGSPDENRYGTEWKRSFADSRTEYSKVGPQGTSARLNPLYNYQGVGGETMRVSKGDVITVTWFNSSGSAITLSPLITFEKAGRCVDDNSPEHWHVPRRRWKQMTSSTIAAGASGTTTFRVEETTGQECSCVNVSLQALRLEDGRDANALSDNVICDKITITRK
ncbi:MAG TPA: hypothetical protein VEK08_00100 [Planctomycetota bacterium]|nr:hypothetical protein [Planctomycetota bacterium]